MSAGQKCSGRIGRYVPWSWGEVFTCSTCGARLLQRHPVQPISPGRANYDSDYPIPAHVAAVAVSR